LTTARPRGHRHGGAAWSGRDLCGCPGAAPGSAARRIPGLYLGRKSPSRGGSGALHRSRGGRRRRNGCGLHDLHDGVGQAVGGSGGVALARVRIRWMSPAGARRCRMPAPDRRSPDEVRRVAQPAAARARDLGCPAVAAFCTSRLGLGLARARGGRAALPAG
jgi:hypothetical protein